MNSKYSGRAVIHDWTSYGTPRQYLNCTIKKVVLFLRHIAESFWGCDVNDRATKEEMTREYMTTGEIPAAMLTKPFQCVLFIILCDKVLNWYQCKLVLSFNRVAGAIFTRPHWDDYFDEITFVTCFYRIWAVLWLSLQELERYMSVRSTYDVWTSSQSMY